MHCSLLATLVSICLIAGLTTTKYEPQMNENSSKKQHNIKDFYQTIDIFNETLTTTTMSSSNLEAPEIQTGQRLEKKRSRKIDDLFDPVTNSSTTLSELVNQHNIKHFYQTIDIFNETLTTTTMSSSNIKISKIQTSSTLEKNSTQQHKDEELFDHVTDSSRINPIIWADKIVISEHSETDSPPRSVIREPESKNGTQISRKHFIIIIFAVVFFTAAFVFLIYYFTLKDCFARWRTRPIIRRPEHFNPGDIEMNPLNKPERPVGGPSTVEEA